ncbi:MAG: hypothetical protein LBS06_08090 [Treponema sp.]|jgi:hypothetical protein|nr:hypothetical protein [Treponema sp.]
MKQSGIAAGTLVPARLLAGLLALGYFCSCGEDRLPEPEGAAFSTEAGTAVEAPAAGGEAAGAAPRFSLEELAEAERLGGFVRGMGLAESSVREEAGDYGGAVIAAYKELAWAFSYGSLPGELLRQGLENILSLKGDSAGAAGTAKAVLAFIDGDWAKAEETLKTLFPGEGTGDGFVRWMLLVCDMEGDSPEASAGAGSVYGSIRARYDNFPEYWYRGARYFSGPIGAEYAERCIALTPQGPFAAECRGILAAWLGLEGRDAAALKSKAEIEGIITKAAGTGNPEPLAELLPLIALPDNAYTFYAAGSLRALSKGPRFREYLLREASGASGRLAERLNYICRDQ